MFFRNSHRYCVLRSGRTVAQHSCSVEQSTSTAANTPSNHGIDITFLLAARPQRSADVRSWCTALNSIADSAPKTLLLCNSKTTKTTTAEDVHDALVAIQPLMHTQVDCFLWCAAVSKIVNAFPDEAHRFSTKAMHDVLLSIFPLLEDVNSASWWCSAVSSVCASSHFGTAAMCQAVIGSWPILKTSEHGSCMWTQCVSRICQTQDATTRKHFATTEVHNVLLHLRSRVLSYKNGFMCWCILISSVAIDAASAKSVFCTEAMRDAMLDSLRSRLPKDDAEVLGRWFGAVAKLTRDSETFPNDLFCTTEVHDVFVMSQPLVHSSPRSQLWWCRALGNVLSSWTKDASTNPLATKAICNCLVALLEHQENGDIGIDCRTSWFAVVSRIAPETLAPIFRHKLVHEMFITTAMLLRDDNKRCSFGKRHGLWWVGALTNVVAQADDTETQKFFGDAQMRDALIAVQEQVLADDTSQKFWLVAVSKLVQRNAKVQACFGCIMCEAVLRAMPFKTPSSNGSRSVVFWWCVAVSNLVSDEASHCEIFARQDVVTALVSMVRVLAPESTSKYCVRTWIACVARICQYSECAREMCGSSEMFEALMYVYQHLQSVEDMLWWCRAVGNILFKNHPVPYASPRLREKMVPLISSLKDELHHEDVLLSLLTAFRGMVVQVNSNEYVTDDVRDAMITVGAKISSSKCVCLWCCVVNLILKDSVAGSSSVFCTPHVCDLLVAMAPFLAGPESCQQWCGLLSTIARVANTEARSCLASQRVCDAVLQAYAQATSEQAIYWWCRSVGDIVNGVPHAQHIFATVGICDAFVATSRCLTTVNGRNVWCAAVARLVYRCEKAQTCFGQTEQFLTAFFDVSRVCTSEYGVFWWCAALSALASHPQVQAVLTSERTFNALGKCPVQEKVAAEQWVCTLFDLVKENPRAHVFVATRDIRNNLEASIRLHDADVVFRRLHVIINAVSRSSALGRIHFDGLAQQLSKRRSRSG